MKYRLPLFLFFILVYLQYFLWFGKNNIIDNAEESQIVAQLQKENDILKLRNVRLFAETSNLYDGLDAIEERARTDLGMIKPNEHFYRLIIEPEQKK